MFKKMFGKNDKAKKSDTGKSNAETDPLIDEDETIVVNLSSEEHPKPDDVRVRFDEPGAPAPNPAPEPVNETVDTPSSEPMPATPAAKNDAAAANGDETVIWTGRAPSENEADASAPAPQGAAKAPTDAHAKDALTVGWLAVNDGPHRGRAFTVRMGRNKIGRGAGNAIDIDIGDAAISKDNHVTVAADPKTQRFFAIPGDSTNFAYLNGDPLLDAQEIADGTTIQIGETTLVFIQFVGRYVDWE